MDEVQAKQCQNGDMRQDILIKRKVNIYSARSYITEVFHGHSMFNTLTAFSAHRFKIIGFDTFIMRTNGDEKGENS